MLAMSMVTTTAGDTRLKDQDVTASRESGGHIPGIGTGGYGTTGAIG